MNVVRHCSTKKLASLFSVQGTAQAIALSLAILFSTIAIAQEKQISYPVSIQVDRSVSSAPAAQPVRQEIAQANEQSRVQETKKNVNEPSQEDAIRSLYESASSPDRKAAAKKQTKEKSTAKAAKTSKTAADKKSTAKAKDKTANKKTAAKPETKKIAQPADKISEPTQTSSAPYVSVAPAAAQSEIPTNIAAPAAALVATSVEERLEGIDDELAENGVVTDEVPATAVIPENTGIQNAVNQHDAVSQDVAPQEVIQSPIIENTAIETENASNEKLAIEPDTDNTSPESESIPEQPAFVDPKAGAPEPAPVVKAVKNIPLPMSENREAYITDFKKYVEEKVAPRLPGIAIAVISEGKIKVLQAYGVKKIGSRDFIDTDTAFRLASVSKTIAGTTAGLLVNEGIMKWDTPVVSILPNVQFSNPRYGNQISLRDILAQSTGLPTHSGDNFIEDGLPFDSVVGKLKSVNFVCPPGKCYGYQNVTFSLFDGMVRNRTGKAYEQYVQEKLFNPLGMKTASFGMAGLKAHNNFALPHTASRKGWQTEVITENYYRMHPAAGANASITDMARWVLAQIGKHPDVLSPAVLNAVHDKVTKNTPTQSHYGAREGVTDTHYGIGWRVFDYRGDKNFVHHAGYVLGFQSQLVFNKELQIGMVALSNSNKMPGNIIFEFLDAYEDEKRGPRKMILPPVSPKKRLPQKAR